MGNITICGSLCGTCAVDGEVNSPEQKGTNLEDILVKEIYEREKISKLIDKEINALKNTINTSIQNLKEQFENSQKVLYGNVDKVEEDANKSILKIEKHIEKIKDNRLYQIEQDVNIVKTKVDNVNDDLTEIKLTLKDVNNNVIKNTTQIDILKKM